MNKLLVSLSVFAIAFVLGLAYQSHGLSVSAHHDDNDDWKSGPCIQIACGKAEGKQQQTRTVTKCTYSCPTVHFEYKEYKDCPHGYKPKGDDKCEKTDHPNKGKIIGRDFSVKSYDVTYNKSQDPNKCHRPSDDTLRDQYKMNREARDAFKRANSELKDSEKKCESHQEGRVVSCVVKRVVECDPTATPTPTPTDVPQQPSVTPAEPTATPVPGEGKQGGLGYEVSCDKDEVSAKFHVTDNGQPMEGIKVTFDYNGHKKDATSNSDGYAIAVFGKDGENMLTATADGFNKVESKVQFPECPATSGGEVLGATTEMKGQVLGYASTGVTGDLVMQLSGVLGTLMVSAGALMHAKQK